MQQDPPPVIMSSLNSPQLDLSPTMTDRLTDSGGWVVTATEKLNLAKMSILFEKCLKRLNQRRQRTADDAAAAAAKAVSQAVLSHTHRTHHLICLCHRSCRVAV